MQRPVSITVFGVLSFVFAVLSVIGLIASITVLGLPADSSNPIIQFIHESSRYAIWLKICVALGALNCALLLVAGFGLLSYKLWARRLSIAYAIYAIVFCLGGMFVNLVFMVQPMAGQVAQQRAFETVAAVGGPISGTIGGFFWLIYPLVLLAFMLRPEMVAAFQPPASLQTRPQFS